MKGSDKVMKRGKNKFYKPHMTCQQCSHYT